MNDVIVSISTALGRGAISIIRLSGDGSISLVNSVFNGKNLEEAPSHTINYGHIVDDEKIIDEVLVTIMRAPKTYTMEELSNTKLLNTGYTIPSLKEVLNLVNGKVPLLIEMKYDNKSFELPRLLIKELKDYNGLVAIQSFDPFLVSYFRFHKNNYLRGLLIDRKIASHILFLKFGILISKPSFLSVQKSLYNNKEINKYKNKKNIISWTMKSKEDIDKYKDKYDNLIVNISNCV